MYVEAIKSFPHMTLGWFHKGHPREVSEKDGEYLIRMRLVNPSSGPSPARVYDTKVIHDRPKVTAAPPDAPSHFGEGAGEEVSSSALPVAPALPQPTQSVSEPGKRKRGRPRKDGSS